MINFRRMMASKSKSSIPLIELATMSGIQMKMNTFATENPRVAITSPRESGKSIFLIQQAILSDKSSIILTANANMNRYIFNQMLNFCKVNNIKYVKTKSGKKISILNSLGRPIKTVYFTTVQTFNNNDILYDKHHGLYIDEFYMMDLATLPLKDFNKCVMIGTPVNTHKLDYTEDQIGLFAGLNIKG